MNDNEFKQILTKIITLEDIDKLLNDDVLYQEVKWILLNVLEGEALDIKLDKLVKDSIAQEALHELLYDAHAAALVMVREDDALEKSLDKAKEDKNSCKELYEEYKALYKEVGEQLVKSLHGDAIDKALDAVLDKALVEALIKAKEQKNLYINSQRKELDTASIDYYLEVSKVLDWFDAVYRTCTEETKEFIKNYIDTIVESDYPNKVLERLQLFQLSHLYIRLPQSNPVRFKEFLNPSLEHLDAFEHLIDRLSMEWGYIRIEGIALENINRKNISAFIEKPDLAPLKIVTDVPEPINFFTFLSALWWALVNRNSDVQPLITRLTTAFKDSHHKYQEYKNYQEELSKIINEYQQIYKSGSDRLASKILDKEGEVKDEIDFKELVDDLCALSQLYCTGIILAKKNPLIDKLFEKFNYPNTADTMVRGKLEVLFWIYNGFYGNINIAGKEFIKKHLDKVMDCDHPKEALNVLYLIYHYKLHDKTYTDTIIDAVLKKVSPEVFFNKFLSELDSTKQKTFLDLKEEDKINALDKLLLAQCSQSATSVKRVSGTITSERAEGPITAWCSFYGCEGQRSLGVDASKSDTAVIPIRSLGSN